MADSDGDSSASSGFLRGLARDIAPGKTDGAHADDDSSSDDLEKVFSRPFTPGVPANARIDRSVCAGGQAVATEADTGAIRHSEDGHAPDSGASALQKRFAELEAAEMLLASHDANEEERPFKKRRHTEESKDLPAEDVFELPSRAGEGIMDTVPPAPTLSPPETVMKAFAAVGLPLTNLLNDVERHCRKLSFRCHPDKVNPQRRWQAAQDFKKIQNAKAVILVWLKEGNAAEDVESDGFGFPASDEESSGMGDAGGVESGSVSDEGPDELLAAGIRPRSMSRSPSQENSEVESDNELGAELVVERTPLHTETKFELGISSSSQTIHMLRKQAETLQSQAHVRTCSECFAAKPVKGKTVCAECHKEVLKLQRFLGGGDVRVR